MAGCKCAVEEPTHYRGDTNYGLKLFFTYINLSVITSATTKFMK